MEGKTGANNSFDIVSSLANFGEVTSQNAADLDMTVNGMQVYRSDNSVTDVIPGVKLDIKILEQPTWWSPQIRQVLGSLLTTSYLTIIL